MTATDDSGIENDSSTVLRYPSAARKYTAADVALYVVVVEGTECGKRIEIGLVPISVGRHSDNYFALADPFVSGRHCVIMFENGQIWVSDLSSSNGTFIDGQRVQQRAVWPAAATLQVGNQMLRREYHRREDVKRSDELAKDLRHAARYVRTLLPQPLRSGAQRGTGRRHFRLFLAERRALCLLSIGREWSRRRGGTSFHLGV